MNSQLPLKLANISGPMIVIFGLIYMLVTFNSRGVSPAEALAFIIAGIAIIVLGIMNIVLVYGRIGQRATIAANVIGLVCFAAAALLTMAPSAFIGLVLFAVASFCAPFVLSLDQRSSPYSPDGF